MRDRLNCVMDIGERMLVCGAEVHRVEDSVGRMCTALGAARVDCFIITSSMVVTIHGDDGSVYTETRRVSGSKFDFHRLDRLNALSRRVCAELPSVQEIREALREIGRARVYPLGVECLAYAVKDAFGRAHTELCVIFPKIDRIFFAVHKGQMFCGDQSVQLYYFLAVLFEGCVDVGK